MAKKTTTIAVLGSRGHGKSALIEALSGHANGKRFVEVTPAPDDLPFYVSLTELKKKAHKGPITKMKVELSDADAGILVVDVADGPGRGTRLHAELAKLATLRLAVVLTKIDVQPDKELHGLVETEVRALLDEFELGGDDAEVIRLDLTKPGAKPKLTQLIAAL